jgi:Ribbon-helix-helix protein, copG family
MEATASTANDAEHVSISLDLPAPEAAALKELAELRGGNSAAAIRQALINDKFVRDRLKDGVEIVLRNPDGQLVKLNWA